MYFFTCGSTNHYHVYLTHTLSLQIVKKSHDGWWTGRIEDTVGDFPASFVEEIEIPRTKQERKQLASRFKRRKSQDKISDSERERERERGREGGRERGRRRGRE